MKSPHIALMLAAACALTAFAAFSADPPTEVVQLRYIEVGEAHGRVRERLGTEAASAVLGMEPRTNTLKLAQDHPQAARIREVISKLDARPPSVRVTAIIKRIIPATATTEAREEVLARPTLIGQYDKPMTLTVGEPGQETLQVELQATHIRGDSN